MTEETVTNGDWIVKLERRSDGKIYFYYRHGSQNARRSSALRMDETTAKQLADAIARQHKTLTAYAMRYDAVK